VIIQKTEIRFEELERLYYLGFTLHWLKPGSKMPVFAGWTKSPRPSWEDFRKQYQNGYNVGVRLGRVSKIGKRYLAVLDLDVKGKKKLYAREAKRKLLELFPKAGNAPMVLSGRGNGSAHFYIITEEPLVGNERKGQSPKTVKVKMPSVTPSKREERELSVEELAEGYRLRPAWEISLLSEGRQVVLPGSVHPDSGRLYRWRKGRSALELEMPRIARGSSTSAALKPEGVQSSDRVKYEFTDIKPEELGLSEEHLEWLKTGDGVTDRSAAVFSICMGLVRRGISDTDIISLFTDQDYYLGQTAFDHAKTTRRSRAARWIDRYCLKNAKKKIKEDSYGVEVFEVKKNEDEWVDEPETKDWRRGLDIQPGPKGSQPTLRSTYKNVGLILRNEISPELLSRNEFSNEDIYQCETPWGYEKGKKRSGNAEDALRVKSWLIETYQLEAPVTTIDEALNTIALENKFHPVKEFLESLEWDGVERVSKCFERYLDARMPEPYLSEVTRKFFLALVSRIYEPGIKFDHLPVFEGAQGIGKSSFGQILVGQEWFLDGLPDLSDKDAALNLQGIWLCEMSELSALYRSQLETAKAFITRQVDKLRPPYGHRRVDFPRQNIFYGTTNLRDYLTDATGGRRYWPIAVHGCDFRALQRDRKQLLAEAKFLFDFNREALYLSGKAKLQAEGIQENRRVSDESDSMEIRFMDWVRKDPEGFDLRTLNLEELFDSGPWVKYPGSLYNYRTAAIILRKHGYEKKHTSRGNRWKKRQH
jgi:predicted P-loop ATPase